jgi:hypothetical protein
MKSSAVNIISLIVLTLITSCNKEENKTSGTITINNELAGAGPYYGYGFHVPTGMKVSNLNSPQDVITLLTNPIIATEEPTISFTVNNFTDSFIKYGQYSNESAAASAFNNLKSFTTTQWEELADSIKPYQIWLFRCSDEKYAKIRIISTFTENRTGMPFPFAECTFEWVYQPDGTQTFQ